MKVLFVCLGNICRSPTAEGVARVLAGQAGLDIETDSAGTAAYHVGNPPDSRSANVAAKRGYPIDDLRARQASPSDFWEFDWIVAMDDENFRNLQAIQPAGSSARLVMMLQDPNSSPGTADSVPDPYYGGPEGFDHVVDLLERHMQRWIAHWQPQ